jgi:alcohol dehydrogenase (cytochrome c)
VANVVWLILLGLAGCAVAATAVPPEPLQQAPGSGASDGADWLGYNNTLDGQRFSLLRELNVGNAASLKEACRVRVADRGSFQAGLVVIEGTIYATTATDTIALDATTCAIKWRHVYRRQQKPNFPVNRGVAYLNGRLFRGTDDGRLIAIDAKTGSEIWRDDVADVRLGESIPGAPVAWNGIVITGISGSEFGVRGRVMAFDALTGRELWRFHTIPAADETGADTWQDTKWNEHGGGSTWSTFTLDVVEGEVFIPVGNPAPDFFPADRPGSNLFTNCVVVLDARTGTLKWWYQTAPNDPFDYDLAAAPVLFPARDGHGLLALGGKDGYLHVVDRSNHQLIAKTAVTTVDAVLPTPSPSGVKVCPGIAGGVEWNGPAFDPDRHLLFVGAVDYCSIVRSGPTSRWTMGGIFFGGVWSPTPDPATGWLTAVDADTGTIKWRYHTPAPVVGAVTPTAGGVLIAGDNAGTLYMFNSDTGEILKQYATGGSLSGGIVTYEQNGKQYLAFTSGNISKTVYGATGRPTIVIMTLPANLHPVDRSANPPDVAHGQQVYFGLCAACHGADGKSISFGGGDLTNIKNRMTSEQLMSWIQHPAPPMPQVFPQPLLKGEYEDLRDLAAFVLAWP